MEHLDDALIFYLASLPSSTFGVAEAIFKSFAKGTLKGQKVPRSKKNVQSKPLDMRGSNFRCLRGVPENTVHKLLVEVKEGKLTLQELSTQCQAIKQLSKIQVGFMKATNCQSWEEALDNYPAFTTPEKLEPFKKLNFSGNTLPDSFMVFCRVAMSSCKSAAGDSNMGEDDDLFVLQHQAQIGIFWKQDVLSVNGESLDAMFDKVEY